MTTSSTTVSAPVKAVKTKDPKEYLLSPPDFRKKVLKPLVVETRKIVNAAIEVGVARHDVADTADGQAASSQATKQLRDLVKNHLTRLLRLAHYHRRTYALAGKKAQRIIKGESSRRVNKPARTLAPYDPQFLNFLREAADSHESLKFFKGFSVLDPRSPLSGMSTQIMISQFLLCYAAVHQRFNPDNRQFIQPNTQMLSFLEAGVKSTLQKQSLKIPELSQRYPGQLRFPYVQTLISFYRRPPTTEEERVTLQNLGKDVTMISTLNHENEVLSAAREMVWKEVRQNMPVKVKSTNQKSNAAKNVVKRAKRAVNALESASSAVNMPVGTRA